MLRFIMSVALATLALAAPPARAGDFGTREEAVAMVQRVQQRFRADGPEATFQAITQKQFNDRDLYPFVLDLNGLNVATGGNTVLVGKNLISLRDQDGKYLFQEIIGIARNQGSGWITYKWPNPLTRRIEEKSTYIERMGDYLVGAGVWGQRS
jgi:signal transduction histidine kinase